jgi:hypothetical protein
MDTTSIPSAAKTAVGGVKMFRPRDGMPPRPPCAVDWEDFTYVLARLLQNPDKMPLPTWATHCVDYLATLRDINPTKYEQLVLAEYGSDHK